MKILNTIEILHENPYTGDKITKARLVDISAILPPPEPLTEQEQQHQVQSQQQDHGVSKQEGASASGGTDHQTLEDGKNNTSGLLNTAPVRDGRQNTGEGDRLGGLVAIKFLSDYKIVRQEKGHHGYHSGGRSGWSSDDENDGDDIDDQTSVLSCVSCEEQEEQRGQEWRLNRQAEGWTLLGPSHLPERIRFGFKAMRELRALKAAQGHPNVIPFLGLTEPPVSNTMRNAQKPSQEDPATLPSLTLSNGTLYSEDTTLASLDTQSDGDPFLGPALGAAGGGGGDSFLGASPLIMTPFRNSGFNSDLGSDFDSDQDSTDDDEDDNTHPESGPPLDPVAATRYWSRILNRQPRLGGIILPFFPLTLQDLIRIGWTQVRPRLVEECTVQILEGLAWIHEEGRIMHRDISPNNIMAAVGPLAADGESSLGRGGVGRVQCMISDFGCATFLPRSTKDDHRLEQVSRAEGETDHAGTEHRSEEDKERAQEGPKGLTFEVGTRAYRAPELLFSSGDYTTCVDLWSAGVIFAEMYLGRTLFEAESDIGQVCSIVKVLGTPSEANWPEYPSMPDYGKLVFQVLETNPLSKILLRGSKDKKEESATEKEKGTEKTEQKDREKENENEVLISDSAFQLIEHLIVYSGAARWTARQGLDFLNQQQSPLSHADTKRNGDDREIEDQCLLDINLILKEKQRLREQEADEDEDGGGHGMYMFGGGGSAHHLYRRRHLHPVEGEEYDGEEAEHGSSPRYRDSASEEVEEEEGDEMTHRRGRDHGLGFGFGFDGHQGIMGGDAGIGGRVPFGYGYNDQSPERSTRRSLPSSPPGPLTVGESLKRRRRSGENAAADHEEDPHM